MANNNYDRMLLGEKQETNRIPNKAKQQRKKQNAKKGNVVKIVICALAILFGLFTVGAAGKAVQGFLLGVFGWLGVAYALCVVVVCALSFAGVNKTKWSRNKKVVAIGLATMVFILMLFSHLWTSYSAYDAVWAAKGEVRYGEYLGYVYHHGEATSGGVLLSLLAYPFLNAVGLRLSGIILAVLFFVVLFALIYPFWLTTKEKRVIVEDTEQEDEPKLFVETVDGDKRTNKARGKSRAQNFDFSYPNGNDPMAGTEDMDIVEGDEAFVVPENADARRQSAMELLLGLKEQSSQVTHQHEGYDPATDKDHPLRFGERHSMSAEWGKPAPEIAREDMPEAERKQQAYDILFGEAPTPKSFSNYAQPKPKPQRGLAAGDTIETVVPSARDLSQRRSTPEPADTEHRQNIYRIPDNGTYVNRAFAPEPRQDERAEQDDAYAPQAESQPYAAHQAPRQEDERYDVYARQEAQTAMQQAPVAAPNETAYDNAVQNTGIQRDFAPERQADVAKPEPIARQTYAPEQIDVEAEPASTPLGGGDSARNDASEAISGMYYGKPLLPEDASRAMPKQYPAFEEESELDRALHYVQDDYVEPEPPVDRNGFVEREEQEPTPPAFNGFVQRQIKETPPERPEPRKEDVKPRFTAVPDERTKQQARAFAPDPKEVKKARPYTPPPLYLLKDYPPPIDTEDYEETSKSLEEAFASYGIEVHVIGHTRGPTYTQYAVRLADGVPFKRVSTLGQDIVRKMCLSEEINIVPKVPNMDAIGVEIINKTRSQVGLKPLLTSNKFRQDKKLYFVLGVDVMGQPYYCDLLKGPHMLIAGSSGSGKSVCLNTLICSLLFNYKPDYVKFILVDPKGGVEMGMYNDLPHNLLGKAAVTPANTIKALDWAIDEMERRYGLMRDLNVRSWGDYNDKLLAANQPRQPYILIIIDELADLMASSKKNAGDIEVRIARLTAKARASGIHVIVATQRPSVDVITGTIKNNIPTRVAFKTATQIDSKTILEKGCAEKLYGRGDMYFMSSEFNELKRLQGPFLSDDEANDICDNIRANNDCVVDESAASRIFKEEADEAKEEVVESVDAPEEEGDVNEENLFERAVRYAASQGFVSISRLQRMFRLGFNRAALLVDEMEAREFIEKPLMGSSKPRRVLITPEECDEIFGYHDDED